jgi:pimeloyl-ACP methyl ester carboxylesterase
MLMRSAAGRMPAEFFNVLFGAAERPRSPTRSPALMGATPPFRDLPPMLLSLALSTLVALPVETPTPKRVEQLVESYFDAPREAQLQIEAELDSLPPLDAKAEKAWTEKLLTRARKGPKVPLGAVSHLYDGKRGKYLVDNGKPTALLVALHGGGLGSGDAESAKGAFSSAASKLGVLTVYPEVLEKTEHGWGEDDTERFVLELIAGLIRTKKVDPDRVYLTGHSMGGYGTYTIGARNADVFAGLAAFAGAPTPYFDERKPGEKVVLDIEDGVLPNLRNVPLFFYQSLDDPRVTPEVNLFVKDALPKLAERFGGFVHRCEIVDGRGHDFPQKGPLPGIEWVFSHPRNARPERVLWQPLRPWKRMFYWLWWEDPQSGVELDVRVEDRKTITVTTESKDVKKLSIFVDAALVDVDGEIEVRVNGDLRHRGVPVPRLSTLLRTIASRSDPGLAFARRIDLF